MAGKTPMTRVCLGQYLHQLFNALRLLCQDLLRHRLPMFPNSSKFWTRISTISERELMRVYCCDMELQSIWTIAWGWYIYISNYIYYIHIQIYVGIVFSYHFFRFCVCFFSDTARPLNTGTFFRLVTPPLHWAWLPYLAPNSRDWMTLK